MSNKHFINDAAGLVDQACKAVVVQHPDLRYDINNKIVFRVAAGDVPRVALISGGGSGHEPAHAGYVGTGMLNAAVCGQVFASPNVTQILQALQRIRSPAGIIAIVKNYTGDKLNFGLAMEEFQATSEVTAKMVLVEDDVAVPRSVGLNVGRRGLAGTVLVHKIMGAASQRGLNLDSLFDLGQHVASNLATIGASLDHCSVPGQAGSDILGFNEIELGMGIHNEPGVSKMSPAPRLEDLVDTMLAHIFDSNDKQRAFVSFGSNISQAKVVLLINNLGGLSALELSGIASVILERLDTTYKIRPLRFFSGEFLTSLNGPGFSISVLNVADASGKFDTDHILSLLDDPTEAVAWPHISVPTKPIAIEEKIDRESFSTTTSPSIQIPGDIPLFVRILDKIQISVKSQEPEITRYDTLMGDCDCGTTLLTGINAVLDNITKTDPTDLSTALLTTATTARNAMGGTSGALYGLFLGAFVTGLQNEYKSHKSTANENFARAANHALEVLKGYTAAREGSRTLMDALIPFVDTLMKSKTLNEALTAAEQGRDRTKTMKSSFGRSTYVNASDGDGKKNVDSTAGLPDPGACGVVAVVKGIVSALL